MCVVISELLCVLFTVARKNLICRCKQRDFFFAAGMGPRLVSISMPFNQHSGAIYLRSKSYLVVNISSDILTKNCCQVCVLSTMTARVCQLRLPAVYRHARGVVEQTQAATCWPVDSWPTWATVVETFSDVVNFGQHSLVQAVVHCQIRHQRITWLLLQCWTTVTVKSWSTMNFSCC